MPTTVQFRRGTTAQNDNFTGAVGEISIDTTLDQVRVHDGVTQGGFATAKQETVDANLANTNAYIATVDNDHLDLSGGTMTGAIAMGTSKITGLGDPSAAQDAATKNYVDTEITNLVDSAPAALDTLNELAAALNDDANFSTTVTNSIATKLTSANLAVTVGASSITTTQSGLTFNDEVLANPDGFITINLGGTEYKVPYFS